MSKLSLHHLGAYAEPRRAILAIEGAGLSVEAHTGIGPVLAYNATTPPDWYGLPPWYTPGVDDDANALCALIRDGADIIACVCSQRRPAAPNLDAALRDGTLFYDHPPAALQVEIDGEGLGAMCGHVALLGAVYVHPAHRHRDLVDPLFCLAVALSWERWHPDHMVGLLLPRRLYSLGYQQYRARTVAGTVAVHDPRWTYGAGVPFALIHASHASIRTRYLGAPIAQRPHHLEVSHV